MSRQSVVSMTALCAYCEGRHNDVRFAVLSHTQHTFMRRHHPYAKEDLFCKTCIDRINAKIQAIKAKEQAKRQEPNVQSVNTDATFNRSNSSRDESGPTTRSSAARRSASSTGSDNDSIRSVTNSGAPMPRNRRIRSQATPTQAPLPNTPAPNSTDYYRSVSG